MTEPTPTAGRILVVEDDTSELATIDAVLTDAGYRVHPTPDTSLALRLLEHLKPDLILVDVGLPDQVGFELCRTIKARDETREIPVVFIGDADQLSDGVRALGVGAVDYIVRPFKTAEILARIKTHISLRAQEERVVARTAELEAADARLSASEERYRRITESITDYVYTVRIEHGRPVMTTSPGCLGVTGYTADEFDAEPELWVHMIVPEDRPIATENVRRGMAREPLAAIEFRITTKAGEERWVRNTPVPHYDDDGRFLSFDGLIQDITERRALQAQLLQAQKMESIGQLAGGIAHDFNNLLTAILGYAQLARASVRQGDAVADDIDEIVKAAERAAHLTSQLLAFARKQLVRPVPLSVSDAVADSQPMLRRMVREDVEILTVLDPAGGLVVADPSQVHQLLVNLVVNAGDAMPSGGRLTIGTSTRIDDGRNLDHGRAAGSAWTVLSVADTGTGMTDEVKGHLFEPFFTTKEPGKGTGMGLATCYGIVKQLGGDIEVESAPGAGTTFRVLLPEAGGQAPATGRVPATAPPVAPAPEAAASPVAPARETAASPVGPAGRGVTVLVVEDEPAVRRMIVATLRKAGYSVLEAADGPAGLDIMTSTDRPIGLLVSDTVMPGLGGRQLAAKFRVRFPTASILMMSGYSTPDLDHASGTAPRLPFLAKPFTPSELMERIWSILEERQSADGSDVGGRGAR